MRDRHCLRLCAVVILLSHGAGEAIAQDAPALTSVSSPARQMILDALIRHRWKPADAAQALGISRATLYRRVHEHRIEMPRMK